MFALGQNAKYSERADVSGTPTTDITLAFDPSRTPPVTDNYFTRRRP
jgi:hypothetical protein